MARIGTNKGMKYKTRGVESFDNDDVMTMHDVMKYLKMCEITVSRMLNRGELPGVKARGGTWRVSKSALDRRLMEMMRK